MRACYKFVVINILLVSSVMVPYWRDRLDDFGNKTTDFFSTSFGKAVGGVLFTASLYGIWKFNMALRALRMDRFMFERTKKAGDLPGEPTGRPHVPEWDQGYEAAVNALLLEISEYAKDPMQVFKSIAEAVSFKTYLDQKVSKKEQMKAMNKALALHLKIMYADGSAEVLSQAITNLTKLSKGMPEKSAKRANVVKIKILLAHALAERFPLSSFIQ